MNDMHIDYGAYFEAKLLEEAHIRDKEFKVTIPALFPEVPESTDDITVSTDNANPVIGGTDSSSLTFDPVMIAKNHTDYYYKLKGDVMKEEMEYTDGITEPFQIVEGSYTDIKEHKHEIKEPITLYNFFYKELNNVKVPAGTLCYGFFINGTYDMKSFVITRIAGAVPLNEEDLIAYQK